MDWNLYFHNLLHIYLFIEYIQLIPVFDTKACYKSSSIYRVELATGILQHEGYTAGISTQSAFAIGPAGLEPTIFYGRKQLAACCLEDSATEATLLYFLLNKIYVSYLLIWYKDYRAETIIKEKLEYMVISEANYLSINCTQFLNFIII